MKMFSPTLFARLFRASGFQVGAAVLFVGVAIWFLTSSIETSRATSFQQTNNNQPEIVISQIYGGGGSSATAFKNDFVELSNRGATTFSLVGWSLQYAAATSGAWQKVELSGSIAPGQYYLIELAAGAIGSKELPAPDARGSIGIDSGAGKVALVKNNLLIINAANSICPSSTSQTSIVDFVGYGSLATCFRGGAPAPSAGNASAIVRRNDGCANSANNNSDFITAQPNPRNSASPLKPCVGSGIIPPALTANLVVTTVTSGAAVPPRGIVAFIINVFNKGPAAATNVVVTDALPQGFTEIVAGTDSGIIVGNSVAFLPVESLRAGDTMTFTVMARAPEVAGRFINRAVANSDVFDPATANNTSLSEVAVLAGAKFDTRDLQVTIEESSQCSSYYTVETRLTNTGVTPQRNNTGAEFFAALPPEIVVSNGSCFASKGKCRTNASAGESTVQWDGDIGVGETVTIYYSVLVVGDTKSTIKFCVEEGVNFDSDNDGQNDATTMASECAYYGAGCGYDVPTEPAIPATSPVTDQKAGSVLFFNLYTSSAVDPTNENTQINITNTSDKGSVTLHLYFVAGDTCEISDSFLCLTPGQTTSFLASDADPDVTGFLIAMVVDEKTGCPINYNVLIGDEYVRFTSGHAGNLGAEAFAAIADPPCECDENSDTAVLALDGEHYNQAPRTLVANNIPSMANNNSTMIILNRVGGDLMFHSEMIGEFHGWLFDDLERGLSFVASGGCQFRQLISNTFPRTAPRFPQFIPGGRTGWMKFVAGDEVGLLGAMLVFNSEREAVANAFNGGHNLHKSSFAERVTFSVPVFPPKC